MLDHELARELLSGAGELAMRYFHKVAPSLKKDQSMVTEADLAVQAYLTDRLMERFPSVGIVAEEDDLRRDPTEGSTYFAIDPIDGTASFVSGLPIWGISVGVIDAPKPVAGYFLMPTTGEFFYTTTDGRVFRNDAEVSLETPRALGRESLLLAGSRFHRRHRMGETYPGKVRCLGSTAAHVCYAVTGSADAALVSGIHVWDVAAGLAMASLTGAVARCLDGDDFVLDHAIMRGEVVDAPVLFGEPATVERYRALLRRKP